MFSHIKKEKNAFPRTSLESNGIMGQSTAQRGHREIWRKNKLAKPESQLKKFVMMGDFLFCSSSSRIFFNKDVYFKPEINVLRW